MQVGGRPFPTLTDAEFWRGDDPTPEKVHVNSFPQIGETGSVRSGCVRFALRQDHVVNGGAARSKPSGLFDQIPAGSFRVVGGRHRHGIDTPGGQGLRGKHT